MKKLLLWVFFLIATAVQAQTGLKEIRQLEGVTEYQLPNGLQLLLAPDAAKPITTVNITYRVGSRHEAVGEHGAAHLLEHMLFKASGSVTDPKREMGARAMRWNGTTDADRTNYFANFLADDERLRWMLSWLAGMMTNARFTKADLDSEMTVVRNEWERGESDPSRVLQERMRAAAYEWHGYGRSTIGARSDIENVSLERLYAFYRKHYRPDNATLIISGKFDAATAKAAVEKAFGPLPRPAAPPERGYTLEAAQDGERSVNLRRAGGLAAVAALYHMPAGGTREGAAARVLAEVLRQRGGPLARTLVAKGLAATEWAFYRPLADPSYLMAGVGLNAAPADGIEPSAALAASALTEVLEKLSLSDEEITSARTNVLAGMRATLRDAESLAQALSSAAALGDWRLVFVLRDWVQELQPDEVRAVARNYLLRSNRTLGAYLPPADGQPQARAPAPERVDATKLIAARADNTPANGQNLITNSGKATAQDTPAFDSFDLSPAEAEKRLQRLQLDVAGKPGLRIGVLPRAAKDDRVLGTLRLRWGTAESVQGSAVLATMIAPLLREGAGNLSGTQINTALQAMDARLNFSSSAGALSASFEFPAAQRAAFFDLLSVLLRQPTFPAVAFERNQKAMLANMQSITASTANVAGNALERSFRAYPEGDPREARSHAQTQAQASAATVEQLRAHWQRFGSAQYGELALLGPVDAAAVQAQLQQALGNWGSAEPHQPWTLAHAPTPGPAWQSIQLPEKSNASYNARIALALNEKDADYPALATAVQLLSRTGLWERVREREGLSYSVGATLNAPLEGNAAALSISASLAPQNMERLRTAVREELVQRRDKGFSASEILQTKSAIVTRRAEAYAQTANVVANIAANLRLERPMTAYSDMSERFATLEPDAVNAALKKYLAVERLVEVAAGSFVN
jgi:zinc protease